MSRPSLLTDELLSELEAIITDGCTILDACSALGISDDTWRRWEATGADDEAAGTVTLHSRFRVLATSVRVSRRRKVGSALYRIATAEPSEVIPAAAIVNAATKWLTLVEKEAPAQALHVSGPEGGPIRSESSEPERPDLSMLESAKRRRFLELSAVAQYEGMHALTIDELRELRDATAELEAVREEA